MRNISRRFVLVLSGTSLALALVTACKSKREPEIEPVPVAPAPAEVAQPAPPAPVAVEPRVEDVSATIEELLRTISTSPLTFIRNGSNHTGKEAAEHIRSKYERARDEVKSPEDFIEKAATRSIMSGKPYQVVLANGTRQPLSDWLKERLAVLRQRP